jgi:hypothetical protein
VQKGTVVRHGVQKRQQSGKGLLEGLIQRQDVAGHFGADGPGIVMVVHLGIAPEQVQHREVRRGFAI